MAQYSFESILENTCFPLQIMIRRKWREMYDKNERRILVVVVVHIVGSLS
jgi:hypothetical protein